MGQAGSGEFTWMYQPFLKLISRPTPLSVREKLQLRSHRQPVPQMHYRSFHNTDLPSCKSHNKFDVDIPAQTTIHNICSTVMILPWCHPPFFPHTSQSVKNKGVGIVPVPCFCCIELFSSNTVQKLQIDHPSTVNKYGEISQYTTKITSLLAMNSPGKHW